MNKIKTTLNIQEFTSEEVRLAKQVFAVTDVDANAEHIIGDMALTISDLGGKDEGLEIELASFIAKNSANIDHLQNGINQLAAYTLQNSFGASELKADIADLRAERKQDIVELSNKHRKSIAQVAAMTSVDFGNIKARTIKVGAAIGHYKGETAIALGASIAPKNNWLINTKLATNLKSNDVTVGLGVSYRFW